MISFVNMDTLYKKALTLRQEGKSYGEISNITNIPKSTLSSWLHNIVLSKESQDRINKRAHKVSLDKLIKRNKQQTIFAQKSAKDIRESAAKTIKRISYNDLLIVGVSLYWAEGYKRLKIKNGKEITSHIIGFTNSDPDMVLTFITFLKRILKVPEEKIFVEMRLFSHMDSKEAVNYWKDITGLAESQFKKPTYPVSIAGKGKRPKDRLPYGTVRVIVSDTKLFHKLLGLIEGLKANMRLF